MLTVNDLSVVFSTKKLFENVNLKFKNGNCYGVIGANGAGKSTLLKVLSGEIDSSSGHVSLEKNERLSMLDQDHFKYNGETVLDTVLSGHKKLFSNMKERERIYAKPEFTEEDGILSGQLEEEFAEMNGWEAESEVEKLLQGLRCENRDIFEYMENLKSSDKVKVLLARAIFGSPDVLLLDEPTNNLDFKSIKWLESYLINFEKTVIVVSHDRHFLNTVCTHTIDIDFGEAKVYHGNYDFWHQSSSLALELAQKANAKSEDKVKKMEDFIARFSANASKSKQATSRKKMLEKITINDIKPSSRKYPYISIPVKDKLGNDVISVKGLEYTDEEGKEIFSNIDFEIFGGEKVFFYSRNENSITPIFEIINGKIKNFKGEYKFGSTVTMDYVPQDVSEFFNDNVRNLIDWLFVYDSENSGESQMRSLLGKMLFSGDDTLKQVNKLSGGEKVRMMFSKMMLTGCNTLILDQPTNHLDLESIQSVNEGLIRYKGSILFSSHDLSFAETLSNKVIEIGTKGAIVYEGTFDEYMEDENIQSKVDEIYWENKL